MPYDPNRIGTGRDYLTARPYDRRKFLGIGNLPPENQEEYDRLSSRIGHELSKQNAPPEHYEQHARQLRQVYGMDPVTGYAQREPGVGVPVENPEEAKWAEAEALTKEFKKGNMDQRTYDALVRRLNLQPTTSASQVESAYQKPPPERQKRSLTWLDDPSLVEDVSTSFASKVTPRFQAKKFVPIEAIPEDVAEEIKKAEAAKGNPVPEGWDLERLDDRETEMYNRLIMRKAGGDGG